jgi:protein-tyrosine phosphatase
MSEIKIKPSQPGCNLRDLGDYALGGLSLRKGLIFRSDALSGLSEQVARKVDDLGLCLVIDLRSKNELDEYPHDLAERTGISYHHIDLSAGLRGPARPVQEGESPVWPSLAVLYCRYLESCTQELGASLSLLARANGPALFNCTAGKDRTGLLAMLVLGLLGADDEAIVLDYMKTKERILTLMPFLASGENIQREGAAGLALLETEPGNIRAAVLHIHQELGGFESYAKLRLGLSDKDLRDLRVRMTAD